MSEAHKDVRTSHEGSGCRSALETLALIGDKWTVVVVGTLKNGPLRYSEIHSAIEGISQRMLTLTLKELEREGLVRRTVFPTVPPRVDYELTELGRTLIEPLRVLFDWSIKHRPAMLAARAAYERRSADGRGESEADVLDRKARDLDDLVP